VEKKKRKRNEIKLERSEQVMNRLTSKMEIENGDSDVDVE
jgi:hypothetical protein